MNKRLQKYCFISSKIAEMNTKSINVLLEKNELKKGWGSNHLISVSGHKVFVKKVPLTQLEYDNHFCTKNIFKLPLYYNYGVGSAGFGAFRELVTHIKTTNWVLNGEIKNFPLMYNYRIIPKLGKSPPLKIKKHKDYVKYWNGNQYVDNYIRERNKAKYEIVLFLEYIPHSLFDWFGSNLKKTGMVSSSMIETIAFLKSKEIVHFDAHFGNILTDGKNCYLTDFGLALDKNFELSKKEQTFLKSHLDYDFSEFIGGIGLYMSSVLQNMNTAQKKRLNASLALEEGATCRRSLNIVIENIKTVAEDKTLKLDNKYVDFVYRHREITCQTNNFFLSLRENPKKNTKFDGKKAGII